MRMTIRSQLTATIIIALMFIVSGLIAIGYWQGSHLLRQTLGEDNTKIAYLVASGVEKFLEEEVKSTTTYLDRRIIRDAVEQHLEANKDVSPDELSKKYLSLDEQWRDAGVGSALVRRYTGTPAAAELAKITRSDEDVVEIFLTDLSGGLIAASGRTSDFYQADEEWWRSTYADGRGKTIVSNVEFDESSQTLAVSLGLPLRDANGRLIAISKVVLDFQSLLAPLTYFSIGDSGDIALINGDGDVLFRPNSGAIADKIRDASFLDIMRAKKDGWLVDYFSPQGRKMFITYREIRFPYAIQENVRWFLVIHQDLKDVFTPLRKLVKQMMGMSALATVLCLGLGILVGNQFSRPIMDLGRAAVEYGKRNFNYRVKLRRNDELGDLAASFNKMAEDLQRNTASLNELQQEIEERKEAEAELVRQKSILHDILTNIPHYVFWKDCNLVYLGCNQAFARAAGVKRPEDIVGKTDYDLAWEKDEADLYRKVDEEVITTKQPILNFEEPQRKADGSRITLLTSKVPLFDEEGKVYGVLGIYADISEQKESERQLRRLSRAVEQSPTAILITDKNGNIEYVNPQFTRASGYALEEVIGKNPRILKSGETPTATYTRLWDTITAGKEWHGAFHNKKKNGELFWETCRISPIRNSRGEITHFVAVKEDITQRRMMEAQLENIQSQLMQSEKMAAIGELSAGVAHEVKNPLAVILLGVDSLEGKIKNINDDHRRYIRMIKDAAERANRVVVELLNFSHYTKINRVRVVVQKAVDGALLLARNAMKLKNIELDRQDLCPGEVFVDGDKTMLEHVVLNIVSNAIDAMEEKGRITVRTALEETPEIGKQVSIQITDTGPGMPPTIAERVFDPFFTTKEQGKGTGLGLSTAYMIIEKHGGKISLETEPGRGTTFHILLPVIA